MILAHLHRQLSVECSRTCPQLTHTALEVCTSCSSSQQQEQMGSQLSRLSKNLSSSTRQPGHSTRTGLRTGPQQCTATQPSVCMDRACQHRTIRHQTRRSCCLLGPSQPGRSAMQSGKLTQLLRYLYDAHLLRPVLGGGAPHQSILELLDEGLVDAVAEVLQGGFVKGHHHRLIVVRQLALHDVRRLSASCGTAVQTLSMLLRSLQGCQTGPDSGWQRLCS